MAYLEIKIYKFSFILSLITLVQNNGIFGIGLQDMKGCNKSRQIIEESWGHISDGPGDYPKESHCEWLISCKYIMIIFFKFF